MSEEIRPGRLHPGIGVGVLVRRGDDLLMLQRAGAHGAGTWTVPGGWIEHGEHWMVTAEREVLEETGLKVEAKRFIAITHDVHPEGLHSITLFIKADLCDEDSEPAIVEPTKCPAVAWLPMDSLPGRGDLFLPLQSLVNSPSWFCW